MNVVLIIVAIILSQLILLGGLYLMLRSFFSVKPPTTPIEVKVSGRPITSEVVRDGVKSALQEIAYEEKQEKILQKKTRQSESIYGTTDQETPVKHAGGNLVPYGLSDSDKEILDMFFDK